jgi:hypothetical protein
MDRHSVLGLSGALAVSALMLAACGSATSGTAAPAQGGGGAVAATSDSNAATSGGGGGAAAQAPCDLLSQADVEAAIGQPVKPNPSNNQAGMCGYASTDNMGFGVNITVGSWDSIQAAARGGAGKPPIAVSGVGDEALTGEGSSHVLYVRKGSQGFLVSALSQATLSSPDGQLALEKDMALKVLAKMS